MPDPRRETVSASQVPALFGVSPWQTPFTLWHELNGTLPDVTEQDDDNERMFWGRTLEPVIVDTVAMKRELLVEWNAATTYARHPDHAIGATVDADIRHPSKGPGVIEAKCADWLIYKDRWTETTAPAYYELQHQAQLDVTGAGWGIISCLVGGNELHMLDRVPQMDVIDEIRERADAFIQSIRDGKEPDPLGDPIEDPFIIARWPGRPDLQPLDMRHDRDANELVREYDYWTRQESMAKKERAQKKTAILAMLKDHSVMLTHNHRLELNRVQIAESFIKLPMDLLQRIEMNIPSDDGTIAAIMGDCLDWHHVTRKAGVQNRITAKEIENPGEPAWGDDLRPDKVKDIWS